MDCVTEAAAKYEIDEVNVEVPWGVIAGKCWGDPKLKPVLVVHGIQDNAGSFDRLIPLLPECFYYVCMELPGHGKSTRIPKGFEITVMHYISSIYRFVKHMSWSKFLYLGHSLGGQIGVYYSAMYPEQVEKLITLDTLPMFAIPKDNYLDHYKTMINKIIKLEEKMTSSSPPNYTYEEAVERLITQRPSPIRKEAAEALVKRMLKLSKNGYYFSTDQRLKFGVGIPMTMEQNICNILKVQCPFLCIMTKITYTALGSVGKGKLVLSTFQRMKNVTIVIVDGYHDVHNNEPHVTAPYISNFLIHSKSHL